MHEWLRWISSALHLLVDSCIWSLRPSFYFTICWLILWEQALYLNWAFSGQRIRPLMVLSNLIEGNSLCYLTSVRLARPCLVLNRAKLIAFHFRFNVLMNVFCMGLSARLQKSNFPASSTKDKSLSWCMIDLQDSGLAFHLVRTLNRKKHSLYVITRWAAAEKSSLKWQNVWVGNCSCGGGESQTVTIPGWSCAHVEMFLGETPKQ